MLICRTDIDRTVLEHISNGFLNKEIASLLGVATQTINARAVIALEEKI